MPKLRPWIVTAVEASTRFPYEHQTSTLYQSQVDAYSGIVTAVHAIDRGDELTIDYGNDYNWKGQTIVTMVQGGDI